MENEHISKHGVLKEQPQYMMDLYPCDTDMFVYIYNIHKLFIFRQTLDFLTF